MQRLPGNWPVYVNFHVPVVAFDVISGVGRFCHFQKILHSVGDQLNRLVGFQAARSKNLTPGNEDRVKLHDVAQNTNAYNRQPPRS